MRENFDPEGFEHGEFRGLPYRHKATRVGDEIAHHIQVPEGERFHPGITAEQEQIMTSILDLGEVALSQNNNPDGAVLALYLAIREALRESVADLDKVASMLASAVMEAAKLRREVRTLTEAQFGAQDGSEGPDDPNRPRWHKWLGG